MAESQGLERASSPPMRNPARTITLSCWILDVSTRPFLVDIEDSRRVDDLKKAIVKKSDVLADIDADQLALWKVYIAVGENLKDIVSKRGYPAEDELPEAALLSDIFPQSDTVQMALHIVVQVPPFPTVLDKRLHTVDHLNSAMESTLVRTAPSEMGKLENYRALQRIPSQRILDDRPAPDSIPPVALLYDGFGSFMDTFDRRGDICHLDGKRRDLEAAVDSFAEKMTDIYDDEADRMEEGLRALNQILSLRSDNKLVAAPIGTVRSEGHYNGPHDAASCVVEFNDEIVDISSIPTVKLVGYAAHSHRHAMELHPEVFRCWRVPCLGLTIVGPSVTFYAIIFLRQWRIVNLTPPLSVSQGEDRKALYAAFSGTLDLLNQIDEDAARIMKAPPLTPIEPADYILPCISALPKYHGTPNETVQFRMFSRHPDTQPNCLLYVAETLDDQPEQIMVKFTRTYSIELHAFCASRGHAPRILGFGHLPGGWSVVAMEYILPNVHPARSLDLARLCDKWGDDLQQLMQSFHDSDFVHGDLRGSNILCDGERVMLIDFDWGGKVGLVSYPTARLCSELRDGRQDTSPKITKDDDRRILQNTLNELQKLAHS